MKFVVHWWGTNGLYGKYSYTRAGKAFHDLSHYSDRIYSADRAGKVTGDGIALMGWYW